MRRLDAFEDRRRQAWERVHELEEKGSPTDALTDAERQKELLEAHDCEGLTRLFERTHAARGTRAGEMTEIAFAKKPVSFTAAVAAAVLFGVSQLV